MPLYPIPPRLALPLSSYVVNGYRFGERAAGRWWLPAWHLGEDIIIATGTPVVAIGAGQVLWSAIRPGSQRRRNWGGLVIIGHCRDGRQQPFYSLYGHITDLTVKVGEQTAAGQQLGVVAPGPSPANGWWQTAHLHFAVYTGPWFNQVLPGYKRLWRPGTKMAWWQPPQKFIEQYNLGRV